MYPNYERAGTVVTKASAYVALVLQGVGRVNGGEYGFAKMRRNEGGTAGLAQVDPLQGLALIVPIEEPGWYAPSRGST